MSDNKPVIECFTTLSALAAMTQTIRLGSLVACNSYRRPSFLAKIASTLDVVSDGRLEFGIGAGWNEEEYRAYGIPFPKPSIKIAQMREGVEIIKRMWTEEHPSFTGQYFRVTRAHCEPKPIQKPNPPITIGGSGEKLTLKVVAEYADRSNWSGSVSEFAYKLKILKAHCSRVGRNYDDIEKSWFGRVMLGEDPQELRKRLKQLYGSGRLLMTQPQTFDDWVETLTRTGLIGSLSECSAKIWEYAELGVTYFMLSFLDSPSTHDMNLFYKNVLTPLNKDSV